LVNAFKKCVYGINWAYQDSKAGIAIIGKVKPLKTKGAELFKFDYKITEQDLKEAEYIMALQRDSLIAAAAYPELEELIFRANPLSRY